MDLFAFKTLLFLLSFIGCCAGTDILPHGPVEAILGRNVTLKTLLDKPEFFVLIWNFNDGTDSINVVTVSKTALKVHPDYQGRVSVNRTNGYLTLASLKADDTGDYSLTLTTESADTLTGEIKLRVLEPVSDVVFTTSVPEAFERNDTVVLTCSAKGSFLKFTWLNGTMPIVVDGNRLLVEEKELSSTLTIRDAYRTDLVGPIYCRAGNNLETKNSAPFNLTVYLVRWTQRETLPGVSCDNKPEPILPAVVHYNYWPLVVCGAVISVLLAGYLLLLYKWKTRNLRTSHGRNMELSVTHENRAPVSTNEDSLYQSLNPASRDQDHIYSSLKNPHDPI